MNVDHILLPTDLSVLSLRPIENAPELFENRIVTLLCVIEDVPIKAAGAPFAPPLQGADLSKKITQAQVEMEEMSKVFPGAREVRIEAFGAPHPGVAITDWAVEHKVDLIALSTHGRTGFRRLVLGSIAEDILRHSRVPVLAFPQAEEGDDAS